MPKVIFEVGDGRPREVVARSGLTLMEVALEAGIEGILGQCGGACSCATCHVYIAESWRSVVGAASDYESELLESLERRKESSRLACQISMVDQMDGLQVCVAGPE